MIISPKERKPSPFTRLMSWAGLTRGPDPNTQQIASESHFRFELEKERSRVDRRSCSSELAIVVVPEITMKLAAKNEPLLNDLCQRLRISDSAGWCNARLSFLLPETGRRGAEVVACDLEKIARLHGVKSSTEIFVYPDDDEIANSSTEFLSLQFKNERLDAPSKMRDDRNGANSTMFTASSSSKNGSHAIAKTPPRFTKTPPSPIWKRLIDITGATAGLLLLSPVFAISALAVRISSPGPIFFRQLREGKNGVPFYIYKFRTMVVEAENLKVNLLGSSEQDGPAFKIKNDPRLTAIGGYLRMSCIDELPQLVNVLTGKMSLVGPRPLPVDESLECLIWQRRRLEVAPGLTCIWQLEGDRNTRFEEWMRMDMEYIRRRSFWFDLKLIVKTVFVAVLHRGSV